MNVIFCPSSAGSAYPRAIALVSSIGSPHLAAVEYISFDVHQAIQHLTYYNLAKEL